MSIFHVLLIIYCSACASTTFANKWYQWGPWSPLPLSCSVTCGFGLRCRIRKCLDRYGVVQPTNALCISSKKYGPKAESCVTCVVNTRCPRIPGWSNWGPWSSCRATNTNATVRKGSCLTGISARFRRCNNPPPKPEPYGMSCVGSNREVKTCFYACSRLPDSKPLDVSKLIHLRIEADHRLVRYPYQVILRKLPGEKVTMSCETDAYKLAKRLTAAKAFNAAKKALMGKTISIAWYRNGRLVQDSQANTSPHQTKHLKKPRTWSDRYLDEEIRWNKLTHPSKFQLEDHLLVIPSIDEGDQGFYTCELRYEEYRWLAAFYSLIVIGVRYVAQATDPFYLHSNLGFSNALRRAPVWLESAQIVWQLNGLEQSRGLAVRLARRIQKIEHLNHTHQGMWLCFLAIPAPGPSERMTSPTARIVSSYLINEFHLKINPATNSLWQIAENPSSVRILRNVATFLSMACLFLALLFLLTVWATRRWINRSLLPEQKKAIVHEILDDATRLMLTARVRATVNKEKLLPLILQEERRLGQADEHIKDMLKQQSEMLNPSLAARVSRLARISAIANSIMSFGKSFYVGPSGGGAKFSPRQSRFKRFSRMQAAEDDDDDELMSMMSVEGFGGRSTIGKPKRLSVIDGLKSLKSFIRHEPDKSESTGRPESENTNAEAEATSPPAEVRLAASHDTRPSPAFLESPPFECESVQHSRESPQLKGDVQLQSRPHSLQKHRLEKPLLSKESLKPEDKKQEQPQTRELQSPRLDQQSRLTRLEEHPHPQKPPQSQRINQPRRRLQSQPRSYAQSQRTLLQQEAHTQQRTQSQQRAQSQQKSITPDSAQWPQRTQSQQRTLSKQSTRPQQRTRSQQRFVAPHTALWPPRIQSQQTMRPQQLSQQQRPQTLTQGVRRLRPGLRVSNEMRPEPVVQSLESSQPSQSREAPQARQRRRSRRTSVAVEGTRKSSARRDKT
ncbi:unnamed protein product [Calicophoron daubneyi]|uniref:Ig-like domain-containing protein n=2 Tax=Calicophoron daubneyi TaxID=300641 RepID=A0AAV2T3G6_CALDB